MLIKLIIWRCIILKMNQSLHPPRTILSVRVGVTGHRPDRLQEANMDVMAERIRDVLGNIQKSVTELYLSLHTYYINTPPVVRLISPLAEGADRIVAREALDLGYELQCLLPFRRDEYEKDFADDASKKDFWKLLDHATAIFEINGSRDEASGAYQTVGNVLLNQCDLLVAVWDGEPSRGPGGTSEVVAEAIAQAIPVIWIESRTPHSITLWRGNQESRESEWSNVLYSQIHALIQPPQQSSKSNSCSITGYYAEKQGKVSVIGWFYRTFRDVLSGETIRRPSLTMPDVIKTTRQEWDTVWSSLLKKPTTMVEFLNLRFLMQYGWADKLADWHANQYRSSFIVNYLLSGFAVLFALLAEVLTRVHFVSLDAVVHFGPLTITGQTPYIFGELLVITAIIFITQWTGYSHNHERWINYRFLAELFRSMRILATMGLVTSFFRIPAYSTFDDVRSSWMNWHYRAVVREAGLPTASIGNEYLKFCRELLQHEVSDQILFHESNKCRYHKIGHRLHRFGVICFSLTLVSCFVHLVFHFEYASWLTLLSAVLPAFGAAAAGLLFQGEFERMELRAAAMQARLKEIDAELIKPRDFSYRELCLIAETVAETMITEVLDWRTMFQTRPLRLS